MRHLIFVFALAALPVACASPGGPASIGRAAETAETADTDASLAYAEIASGVNAYKALATTTAAQADMAEALKVQAWGILTQERRAYAAGQTFDSTGLQALVVQTSRLGH